jgi:gamma-tubulin complex component 5
MAQNARIGALTDELIQTIVGFKPEEDRRAYKHAKDIATRGLKAHQYNRTNQFEVRSSFEGLDEKFRVLNRDDLADALQTRVQELKGIRNKWIPDYLALLLRLSDRPTENSEVEALELLRPPTPPPPLTWAEIIEDDPYSDEEIWKDIDYAAESSDEEQVSSRGKKTKKVSPPSPIDDDDTYSAESCLQPVDTEILPELEKGQFWKAQADEKTGKVEVAELQAIRETLFMLAGHQTALYHTDKAHGSVRVKQTYVFTHAMPKTMDHLLGQFATIGRDLYRLRMWTSRSSSLPLVQTFESAVRRRLGDYDKSLALLQGKYLVPEAPRSVSLLELHVKVRELSSPLLRLSQLVADIEPQLLVNPFAHLETLFEQITLAQMTLEKDLFAFLSDMFFECLQTYLKPIRRWMEAGELGANDETFFVFENDSGSEASSLWHDRFVLRRGKGDTLRSPTFLEPAAMKIFNTGKSVVFLKELGIYDKVSHPVENEPRLDHPAVCGTADLPLSPFPELFHSAFETWIRSKYSLASTVLRSHLFEQCGLLQILDNFHLLYLGADGSLFQGFADAIFERMDSKQRGWNDRFLLTELARGVYGTSLTKSNAEKIVVRSVRTKTETRLVKGLATLSLDYAVSTLTPFLTSTKSDQHVLAPMVCHKHHPALHYANLSTSIHIPSASLPCQIPPTKHSSQDHPTATQHTTQTTQL